MTEKKSDFEKNVFVKKYISKQTVLYFQKFKFSLDMLSQYFFIFYFIKI